MVAEPLTLAWTAINCITSQGTKITQDQRFDVFTAMKAITITAARDLKLENQIGSIKVGKTANFTILAENPFKVYKRYFCCYHGKMHLNKKLR